MSEEQQNEIPTTEEGGVPTVPADNLPTAPDAEIEANLREKLEKLHSIHGKQLMASYYQIGQELIEVFEDQSSGGKKFGGGAMERIADELCMSPTNLYRCQEVAVNFSWDQLEEFADAGNVKWSHIREAVRIPDPDQRVQMLKHLNDEPKTVVDFKKQVDIVRGEHLDGTEAGRNGAGEGGSKPNAGGGSRTGTGRGPSPLTAVKKGGKQAEKLSETLKDALVSLIEFDPDSDLVADRMADAVNEMLGNVCDVMTICVGLAQKAEEYMACYPNKQRDTAAKARAAALEQVVPELAKLAGAIEAGTLGPEEDPNKQDGPKSEKEKQKEAKKQGTKKKAAAKKGAPKKKGESAASPKPPTTPPKKAPPASAPMDPVKVITDEEKAKAREEMKERARKARERKAQQDAQSAARTEETTPEDGEAAAE